MSEDRVKARIADEDNEPISGNNPFPVAIQDQHSPVLIVPMNKVENTTTLTSATAIDDTVISVTSATGFAAGKFVTLTNIVANRYYTGEVVSVASLDITLDTPVDFAFPTSGTIVTQGTHDLVVDGSGTTQIFSLRASDPGLPVEIDITRLIFKMTTTSAIDLSKFGNLNALGNGLVLRRVDGTTQNILNIKTNGDIAGIMFDWTPFAATNPQQGIDGFVSRLTFAGQGKIGVTVRVGQGEDLQLLIQDDLTANVGGETITTFKIMVEGHVVI